MAFCRGVVASFMRLRLVLSVERWVLWLHHGRSNGPFQEAVIPHVSEYEGGTPMALVILRGLTGSGKSTVATILTKRHARIVEIGIDKIREENPRESYCFPGVGRRAKCLLGEGVTVIVHDAFDNQKHAEMFLKPKGLSLADNSVYVFRLQCTKGEAIERNSGKTDPEVELWQTEQEYRKVVEELSCEVIISTSNKSACQVADDIARQVGLAN